MPQKVGLAAELAFMNEKLTLHGGRKFLGKKAPHPEKLKPVNRRARRAIKSGRKKSLKTQPMC